MIIDDSQKPPAGNKKADSGNVAFKLAIYPGACPAVINIVKYLVMLLIFLLPLSPSFCYFWK